MRPEDLTNDQAGGPGGTVARWADEAMFSAEEMPEEALSRPQVHLLWMTPDPLGAAAAMNSMYEGKVKRSLGDVTRAEREQVLSDFGATVLKAPAEAIKLHFLIEGVTRGFTHQLVRQRTAVYAQESTRFAVFGQEGEEIPAALPPSLMGPEADEVGTKEWNAKRAWYAHMETTAVHYRRMVDLGMPAEDARGILPTNLLTRIHYVTDLRNLHAHAGLRLSTQAQFEWRVVWAGIINAIRSYNPMAQVIKNYLDVKAYGGSEGTGQSRRTVDALEYIASGDAWQYEAISNVFRPVCYYTGKCEFMGKADRYCNIRDRVQANHAIGRPSSEWHIPHEVADHGPLVSDGPVAHDARGVAFVGAIHPREWLENPAAARKAPGA